MAAKKISIHHFSYPSRHLLAATFLRIQEHYESPKFRGVVFTWEEFMDWHASEHGAFTYLSDWSGFNLPSTAFAAFHAGSFDPLTEKEQALLAAVKRWKEPFYVIATEKNDEETLSHEIVHGLYFLYPDYRAAVDEELEKHDLARFHGELLSMGYGKNVLNDEVNAYLVTDLSPNMMHSSYLPAKKALSAIFTRYFGCKAGKKLSRIATKIHYHPCPVPSRSRRKNS